MLSMALEVVVGCVDGRECCIILSRRVRYEFFQCSEQSFA